MSYPDYPSSMRDCAVSAIWKQLAPQRQRYAGLSNGLDYLSTLIWPNRIKNVAQKSRTFSILQDGVWTPARAARVNAGNPNCLHCGASSADTTHLWWQCSAINRNLCDADPTDGPFTDCMSFGMRPKVSPNF